MSANKTAREWEGIQAASVVWYRKNGLYPQERISHDASGHPYVLGDQYWNRHNPDRQERVDEQCGNYYRSQKGNQ